MRDLAADEPDRLAELQAAWEAAAWENQIFPLDEGTGYRFLLRPPWTEVYDAAGRAPPGNADARPVALAAADPLARTSTSPRT